MLFENRIGFSWKLRSSVERRLLLTDVEELECFAHGSGWDAWLALAWSLDCVGVGGWLVLVCWEWVLLREISQI